MCTAIDEMREESKAEGRSQGVMETLASLVKKGMLSLADAAKEADLTPSEFQAKVAEMK